MLWDLMQRASPRLQLKKAKNEFGLPLALVGFDRGHMGFGMAFGINLHKRGLGKAQIGSRLRCRFCR